LVVLPAVTTQTELSRPK